MGKNGYGGPASTNTGGVVMNVSSIEETTPIKPAFESTSNHGFGMVEYADANEENSPWKNQRPGGYADHGVKMIFVRIQWQHPLRLIIEYFQCFTYIYKLYFSSEWKLSLRENHPQ